MRMATTVKSRAFPKKLETQQLYAQVILLLELAKKWNPCAEKTVKLEEG